MKTKFMYLVVIIAVLNSCSSTKTLDANQIKKVVEKEHFNIESDIAQPSATIGLSKLQNTGILGAGNSASNISLIGNSNFLTIIGDSIISYLPYYGERHSSIGYGTDNSAIEFEGKIKNYNATWNDKKQHYSITFQARSHQELFDVRMILYPNLKSYITLTSASRSGITYIGKVNSIWDNDV